MSMFCGWLCQFLASERPARRSYIRCEKALQKEPRDSLHIFYSRNLYLQSMGCDARHFAHAVWSIGKALPQNPKNQGVKESRALLKVLKHASDDSS